MSIQFRCRCGSLLFAESTAPGKSIRCPMCLDQVTVPTTTEVAPQAKTEAVHASLAHDVAADPVTPPVPSLPSSLIPPMVIEEIFHVHRDCRFHQRRLRWMAGIILGAAVVQLVPIWYFGLGTTPNWMRLTLLISALEITMAIWMLTVPDWSTLWVATLGFAAVAVIHAFALALAVATPLGEPDLLEMNSLRDVAELWLVMMLLVSAMISFGCGQIGFQWRQDLG